MIDKFFLIHGGIGIVLTALIYSIFTKWGFFKVKWVGVKWVLTEPLPVETFPANVRNVAIAGIVQLIGFAAILILPEEFLVAQLRSVADA